MDFITIIIVIVIGVILISFVSGIVGIIIIIVAILLLVSFFTRSDTSTNEDFAQLIGMGGANFSYLDDYDFKFNLKEDNNGYIDTPDGCVPFRKKPYLGGNVDDYKQYGKMNDYNNVIDMAPYLKECWKLGTFRNCWHDGKAFQGNVID
jgi:hypothetical protein